MKGMGNIYKSNEEINERKAEIKERDKNRKSSQEIRNSLIKHFEKDNASLSTNMLSANMEKELNYLSEKIEKAEHDINLCEFGLDLNASCVEDLEILQNEKTFLENILNKLTEIELTK